MITPIFDEVDESKVVGSLVDGEVVLFPPVPEGDSYDDLWDLCCATFEKHPRLRGRIDAWFCPNTETGRHTDWLGNEVSVWIREGNLRSHTQVNEAATEYANHWDRLARFGVIGRWVIDLGTIKSFRWFFAVSGSKPLPSKDEYLAEQKEWELREAERIRQASNARRAEQAEMETYEKSMARDKHILDLVQSIAEKLWTFEGLELGGDELPPEYVERSRKRSTFRKFNRALITQMVDSGMTDEEIKEWITMDYIDDLVAIGKSEVPPLQEGETRRFFTRGELHQFMRDEWDAVLDGGNETSLMLGMDELFVVTIRPTSPSEAEQTPAAVQETAGV
jgi:hypothetical protein